MALPRKGSRRITVGGHRLRWAVGRHGEAFRLQVERRTEPGMRLVAMLPLAVFPADAPIVSPAIVRQCVLIGLANGFDPDRASGEQAISIEAGQLDFGKVDRERLVRPVGRPRKRAVGEKRKPVYLSLEPEDRARLQALADARGIGMGTLAREWVLERLREVP